MSNEMSEKYIENMTKLINGILEKCNGNQSLTAKTLGISKTTVRKYAYDQYKTGRGYKRTNINFLLLLKNLELNKKL